MIGYLQAKIAEYMGPDRKIHLRMLALLSLNQRVVRMKARKLVTMERMKMWSSLRRDLEHYLVVTNLLCTCCRHPLERDQ